MMADEQAFTDHYKVLQVRQDCDAKALEAAYRRLAKMYHPDHPETADAARFTQVIGAYRALRNPERRAEYDLLYEQNVTAGAPYQSLGADGLDEGAALDDADDHAKILMFLYKRRREDAQKAGVIAFYLQDMLKCSDERFEFHKWYLKEKGFIAITEQGTLAITIQGVDHVISMSRATRAERLLIEQSRDPKG